MFRIVTYTLAVLWCFTGFTRANDFPGKHMPIAAWFGPAAPDDPNGIFTNLRRFISIAESTLFCAIHELDVLVLAQDLAAAKQRGVRVEIILESQWMQDGENQAAISILREGGVKIIPDHKKSGLMHNKYLIADRKRVWSGSANLTINCLFLHYNDSIWLESQDAALRFYRNYLNLLNPPAGGQTFPSRDYRITIGETPVDIWFSPEDRPTRHFVNSLYHTREEIRFTIFAYSSAEILDAMLRANRAGVKIAGIFDDSFSSPDMVKTWKRFPYGELSGKPGVMVTWDGEGAKVHHKHMILDKKTVITGSFNFSQNAEKNNDENITAIHSPELAEQYIARQKELWKRFKTKNPEFLYQEEYQRRAALSNQIAPFWEDFRKEFFAKSYRKWGAFCRTGSAEGIMKKGVSGGEILVEVPEVAGYVSITLAGCVPPVSDHGGNQELQSIWAGQTVVLRAVNKPVRMVITKAGDGLSAVAIVYHSFRDGTNWAESPESLNEIILRSGWAWFGNCDTEDTGYPHLRRAYLLGRSLSLGLWSKQFRTADPPWVITRRTEERMLSHRHEEALAALREWKEGCVIANPRSKKYYTYDEEIYWKMHRATDHKNLVFFENVQTARGLGYTGGRSEK